MGEVVNVVLDSRLQRSLRDIIFLRLDLVDRYNTGDKGGRLGHLREHALLLDRVNLFHIPSQLLLVWHGVHFETTITWLATMATVVVFRF